MRALFVLALLSWLASPGFATSIPTAHGTATIDGVKSPGEWDAATAQAVFASGTLPGSFLWVMDDDVNIYVGLFVPDHTFTPNDLAWVRFDSKHDGVTMVGDDEVNGSSVTLFDSHFDGVSWAIQDLRRQGSAAVTSNMAGNFFEISHPLNTGDPDDLFVGAGQTIGLCVFYANDGTIFGGDDDPTGCLGSGLSQSTYVDYTISSVASADPMAALAFAHIALTPNPVRQGAELAIDYGVPPSGVPPSLGLYTVSGRKLDDLGPLSHEPGNHALHWQGAGALSPGVYFVRARYQGAGVRSKTLIVR